MPVDAAETTAITKVNLMQVVLVEKKSIVATA